MTIVARDVDKVIRDFINVKNFDVNADDPNRKISIGNAFLDFSDDNATLNDIDGHADASIAIQKAIDFAQAAQTSNSVYGNVVHIPAGVYVLKKPIYAYSCILQGEGPGTVLIGVYDDPNQPLVQCGYSASIRDLCIRYNAPLISTGSTLNPVGDNQYVLIKLVHPIREPGNDPVPNSDGMYDWVGYNFPTQKETHIIAKPYETQEWVDGQLATIIQRPSNRAPCEGAHFVNLLLTTCGTAIEAEPSNPNELRGYIQPFSCEFRNIFITHFSHRGIDLRSWWCSGSVFSNIMIDNYWNDTIELPEVDCGFYLGESSSEHTIHQLNIQNFKLKNLDSSAMYISGCNGFVASTVHIEAVYPTANNQSFIKIKNSSCSFQQLMICNATYDEAKDLSYTQSNVAMFEVTGIKNILGLSRATLTDAQLNKLPFNNNYLNINILNISSLGEQNDDLYSLNPILIRRNKTTSNEDAIPYNVDIGNYSYSTGAWKIQANPTGYNNALLGYKNIKSSGNVRFVQKYYLGQQPITDSTINNFSYNVLAVVERDKNSTKAKPTFNNTVPNAQPGQLVACIDPAKVYFYTGTVWKALN